MHHLVAHAVGGRRPLSDPDACNQLWSYLRRGMPNLISGCLMPEHVHSLDSSSDPDEARRRFARVLSAFARHTGQGHIWEALPEPTRIPDAAHLARQVRYVHLNPCRRGLVDDPLSWPWSTYRGALGLEIDTWDGVRLLPELLGRPKRDFGEWLHGYVSSDPSVQTHGTPFPAEAPPRRIPTLPLADIAIAAAAAAPGKKQRTLRRHLFVLLARHQGWRDARLLAEVAHITPTHVRRLAHTPSPHLRIAAFYLNDVRLRISPTFQRPHRSQDRLAHSSG